VGSIPDDVNGFSIDLIVPVSLKTWGANQPLREMRARNLPGE
jgi:hypothetical protein